MPDPNAITRLLNLSREGDRGASSALWEEIHAELHALADGHMGRERDDHTLQPTALAHEAWMRLVGATDASWQSRGHFYAMASKVMRSILVDHARRKKTEKRGGSRVRVALEERAPPDERDPVDLVDLDQALEELAGVDPDRARILEMRYFGGLSIAEISGATGTPVRTVERRLAAATGWVREYMSEDEP